MEKNENPSISAESFDQLVQEVAAIKQTLAQFQDENKELVKLVLELRTKLEKRINPPIIQENLPESQKAVLQAILDLPDDAFADAEKLMATIEGQPMTKAFADSFKAILRVKEWGVVCKTCEKPSVIHWRPDARYSGGGNAQFIHSSPSPHGSIAVIGNFQLVKKIDQRRKQK